jgi:glycosyltransferase involved in cell wall biosynthesis
MQPRKNLPFLIGAFANIANKLPAVKLVIAGKKARNYDRKIDHIIEKYNLGNNVLFPGFVEESDKPILFKLSRFFVFPSLYEGFGIPVLEAMSQGVPVLASDIPSLREVAGDAALYFNPSSLASLERKLYNIFIDQNLRKNLVNLGRKRSHFFSWSENAKIILDIYLKLGMINK